MADIGNAIEAVTEAIRLVRSSLDSNFPPGPKNKAARRSWTAQEINDYNDWTQQLKRFNALRKKLLAIERAA
jgi:hypothetical protein